MLYNFTSIKDFLYKPGQFYEIPTFQRPYSWGKEDATLFIEDLENIHANPSKEHYFGSMICDQNGSRSDIIDGQQRATTVLLMLTALYHLFQDFPNRATETYHKPEVIRNHFLYNEDSAIEENRIKLRTVTVDNLIFEKIFSRKPLSPTESSSRLNLVYQYFYDYFKNKPDSTTYIEDLKRFRVIDLTIQKGIDDGSQRIFESINSTGHPLTDGDKIRNFALMLDDDNIRNKVYTNYWKKIEQSLVTSNSDENLTDFFRLYLISVLQREVLKRDGLTYIDFKTFFKNKVPDTSDEESVTTFFKQITDFLDYYLLLKFPNKISELSASGTINKDFILKCTPPIIEAAFRLNYLRIETPFPFLMQILNFYSKDKLTENEVLQVFGVIESYLIRRQLSGLNTTSLNKIFFVLHKNVLKLLEENPSYSYNDILNCILLSYRGDTEFPRNEKVYSGIRTEEFYSLRNWTQLFILCSINDQSKESATLHQIIKGEGGEKALNLSIEHIMPQTISNTKSSQKWKEDLGPNWYAVHEKYLHTLPNLTLTGYNSEYSNLPYYLSDKPDDCKKTLVDKHGEKVGLDYSNLRINLYFRDIYKWDEEAIKRRANWYDQKITDIWPLPKTSFELPSQEETVKLDDSITFKDRKAISYSVLGNIYPAEKNPWIDIYQHIMYEVFNAYPELYQKYLENATLVKNYIAPGPNPKFQYCVPLDTIEDTPEAIKNAHFFLNSNLNNDAKIHVIRAVVGLLPEEAADNLDISFTLLRQG